MFGNSPSPTKDGENGSASPATTGKPASAQRSIPDGVSLLPPDVASGEKVHESGDGSGGRRSGDEVGPPGDKRRRSGKASSLIASAKNSLHLSSSSNSSGDSGTTQTPLQKLGKKDPALAVPQGPQNNSAGESLPSARSTFRVGVTEDKNKKCRRTMEDTHSYLYNFLSTPAPAIGPDSVPTDKASSDKLSSNEVTPANSTPSLASGSTANVIETDNGYFAIFDGHAGSFAADWCGKKLHIILEDAIRKNPNTPVPELLDQTFTNVDHQLEKLPLKNSGCTAVTAVLRWEDRVPNDQSATGSTAIAPAAAAAMKAASEAQRASSTDRASNRLESQIAMDRRPSSQSNLDITSAAPATQGQTKTPLTQAGLQESAHRQRVLYTANVGDARIVLCRNGKALRLSYDHKGSDENEGKRVSNAGGLILNNRVNGVLAVTRALGDAYMKDLVTGHPYTTETVIQPELDEFLILACDGLWDVCSDQEAVDLIRHTQDPQTASKMLVDHALARFSTDNLSCMVVRFDGQAVQDTVNQRSERIGVEGDPSTQKGGISEADAIVLGAQQKVKDIGGSEITSPEKVAEEERGEPGPELQPGQTKK